MATAPKSWSTEEDEQLKKLTLEGLSASMIAERMPGNRSRNSIIGRQHRLGIMGKQTQRKKRASRLPIKPTPVYDRHTLAATSAHVRALRSLEAKMRYAETSKAMRETPSEVEPLMIPLLDLEPHHCRWPIGDVGADDFGFCGHPKRAGVSYCEFHATIAFNGIPRRRSQRPEPRRKAA